MGIYPNMILFVKINAIVCKLRCILIFSRTQVCLALAGHAGAAPELLHCRA